MPLLRRTTAAASLLAVATLATSLGADTAFQALLARLS